jgi:hypothetical protein
MPDFRLAPHEVALPSSGPSQIRGGKYRNGRWRRNKFVKVGNLRSQRYSFTSQLTIHI